MEFPERKCGHLLEEVSEKAWKQSLTRKMAVAKYSACYVHHVIERIKLHGSFTKMHILRQPLKLSIFVLVYKVFLFIVSFLSCFFLSTRNSWWLENWKFGTPQTSFFKHWLWHINDYEPFPKMKIRFEGSFEDGFTISFLAKDLTKNSQLALLYSLNCCRPITNQFDKTK